MADDLGLTEHAKELAKWNKPYVFQPYPRMLYRVKTLGNGSLAQEQRIVGSEGEQLLAVGQGWMTDPEEATQAEVRRQEDRGTAAAERAWTDRRMSASAQAEAAAVDAATAKHLPEIPEAPKRVIGRPFTRKQEE